MNLPSQMLLPPKAGRDVLTHYGFCVEATTVLDNPAHEAVADLITSAHAPFSNRQGRLSIADTNDAIRDDSIREIEDYISQVSESFPNLKQVNMHASPKRWRSQMKPLNGSYDRLIAAIRQIGEHAAKHNLTLTVENNRAYWVGVSSDTDVSEVDREGQNEYFGTAPEEWIDIQRDVDQEHVFLCLDTSHACTYAQTFADNEEREAVMLAYLDAGERLRHFHWNGNDLVTNAGREDRHYALHKDSLSDDLHARIKHMAGTHFLEHWYGETELEEELAFIDALDHSG